MRSKRLHILATLAVAFGIWGWVDVRVRGRVDPNDLGLHKSDFTVYTEAGSAFFDGRRPYEVTNPRGWGYLYPPPFAMLVAPLHALDPQAQALVWFVISVLALYGCYSESLRIARIVLPDREQHVLFGPLPVWIGWSAFVAGTLPALNCLQRGQVGVVVLYLLLVGFRLLLTCRGPGGAFLAGCILAMPVVLKVAPLVPVGFLVFERLMASWSGHRAREPWAKSAALAGGVGAGLILLLLIVPAVAVGWSANVAHLKTWWTTVAVHLDDDSTEFAGDSSSPRNQSLTNATQRLGNWIDYAFDGGPNDEDPTRLRNEGVVFAMDAPQVEWALLIVRLAAGLLLLAVGYRVARSGDVLALAAAFGLACVSTLVLGRIARGHYFVLLLPAAMFTSAWLMENGRRRAGLATAIVPAALSIAHYVLLDYAGRIGVLGLGTAMWYAAACIMLIRGRVGSGVIARQAQPEVSGNDECLLAA